MNTPISTAGLIYCAIFLFSYGVQAYDRKCPEGVEPRKGFLQDINWVVGQTTGVGIGFFVGVLLRQTTAEIDILLIFFLSIIFLLFTGIRIWRCFRVSTAKLIQAFWAYLSRQFWVFFILGSVLGLALPAAVYHAQLLLKDLGRVVYPPTVTPTPTFTLTPTTTPTATPTPTPTSTPTSTPTPVPLPPISLPLPAPQPTGVAGMVELPDSIQRWRAVMTSQVFCYIDAIPDPTSFPPISSGIDIDDVKQNVAGFYAIGRYDDSNGTHWLVLEVSATDLSNVLIQAITAPPVSSTQHCQIMLRQDVFSDPTNRQFDSQLNRLPEMNCAQLCPPYT